MRFTLSQLISISTGTGFDVFDWYDDVHRQRAVAVARELHVLHQAVAFRQDEEPVGMLRLGVFPSLQDLWGLGRVVR
jgi:hypothetical protein